MKLLSINLENGLEYETLMTDFSDIKKLAIKGVDSQNRPIKTFIILC